MKKVLSLILALLFVFSALAITASAADDRAYITFERETLKGIGVPKGYYILDEYLEKMPATFEAWVYIPKEEHTKRVGVILGNSFGSKDDDSVTFEILEKGVPSLYFRADNQDEHTYKFTKAAVPADTWTHVAIVYGGGTDNKQVLCYINGALKESSDVSAWYQVSDRITENLFTLAGDRRPLNTNAFRGRLGDVVAYADARTADEIAADAKNKPDTSDENLMMYFDMSTAKNASDIKDSSKNGYTMNYYSTWLTSAEQKAATKDGYDYTYSIAFLPDIQYTTDHFPKKLPNAFDWIIENKDKYNMQYFIGLGDMTDHSTNNEWKLINDQYKRLDGVIPYSLIRGNHDGASLFDSTHNSITPYYKHVQENGGMMKEKSVVNTYLLFEVGDVKYIIINLDFGATDDVLSWVDGVLEANSDRRAIIVTHGFMNRDGTPLSRNDYASPNRYNEAWNSGDDMWEKCFKKHANVQMVVSGHISCDDIICTEVKGDNGNVVYQILMDMQSTDDDLAGAGFVTMMYFTEDGNHARVDCYSSTYKKYFRGANNAIHLNFAPEEEEVVEPIGTVGETEAPATTSGGCGSSVALALPTLFVATAAGVALVRKKKKED